MKNSIEQIFKGGDLIGRCKIIVVSGVNGRNSKVVDVN